MPQTYEFYIFHRAKQDPIYTRVFKREAPEDQRNPQSIVRIINTFAECLKTFGTSPAAQDVRAITTDHYKLHHFETPTGLRFVVLTDTRVQTDAGISILQEIYRRAYVELVAKDPTYDSKSAVAIESEAFDNELHQILRERKLL